MPTVMYVDLKIEKGALRSLFQICGFRLAVEGSSRTHGTFMFTLRFYRHSLCVGYFGG